MSTHILTAEWTEIRPGLLARVISVGDQRINQGFQWGAEIELAEGEAPSAG